MRLPIDTQTRGGQRLLKKLFLTTAALIFFFSNAVRADVINGSAKEVFAKHGDNSTIIPVAPGGIYKGDQDGVVSGGKVFKNSDGVNLIVGADGVARVQSVNPITLIVEAVRAGELESAPDATWNNAFQKAREQASVANSTADSSSSLLDQGRIFDHFADEDFGDDADNLFNSVGNNGAGGYTGPCGFCHLLN